VLLIGATTLTPTVSEPHDITRPAADLLADGTGEDCAQQTHSAGGDATAGTKMVNR
jgi:hypothetical protein